MLPRFGTAAVQVATTVGPVTTVGQLVDCQPLAAVAGTGVQVAAGVGPVVAVLQVVVV